LLTDAEDPLHDDHRGACSNSACDHGWVSVARDEDGMYLGPNPGDPAYADKVETSEVYPCPECNKELFLQATNGCFLRNHRPCERCRYRRSNRSHV
jgi:hypothetical protein